MWKPERVGLIVLACGAVVGLITGGPFGLALAAICLVVGLVLVVTTEAMGTLRNKKPEIPAGANQPKSQVLFLVKEVHARAQLGGRFQEIRDPDQTDLQFEVFANCWLVNDTDDPLLLKGLRIWLRQGDGSDVSLERITGDLEGWRLGRLRDELDTWGERYIQAAQESMVELNLKEPLQGGVAREGWIHFRMQNISPNDLKKAPITVSVQDSRGRIHVAAAKGPHQVPGRVWPFQARLPVVASKATESPLSSNTQSAAQTSPQDQADCEAPPTEATGT